MLRATTFKMSEMPQLCEDKMTSMSGDHWKRYCEKVTNLILCFTSIICVTSGGVGAEKKDNNDSREVSGDLGIEDSSPRPRRSGYDESGENNSRGRSYNYNDDNKRRVTDLLGQVKSKIKPKISSLLSVSSPGHYPDSPPAEYGPPVTYGHKSFNLWGFKKAIFGAIVQAVKAITGGVLALKGQLIKVKGHLVETKGKILQTKGEAISNFGRHVATKALLNPPQVPPSAASTAFSSPGYPSNPPPFEPLHGHGFSSGSYGPPPSSVGSVGLPSSSGPSGNYGPPPPPPSGGSVWGPPAPSPPAHFSNFGPAPSPSYGVPLPPPNHEYGPPPSGFGPYKRDTSEGGALQDGVQAGLLVLKPFKVPSPALRGHTKYRRSRDYTLDNEEEFHRHIEDMLV
ncbi:uncharacterized protein LOC142321230 [Lycorma delicatula]|uniref:uncharacterized protein LOC142321230 n=1 Tax=Lycorma delicatula TaxID=130591 RepID=UPI003F5137EC